MFRKERVTGRMFINQKNMSCICRIFINKNLIGSTAPDNKETWFPDGLRPSKDSELVTNLGSVKLCRLWILSHRHWNLAVRGLLALPPNNGFKWVSGAIVRTKQLCSVSRSTSPWAPGESRWAEKADFETRRGHSEGQIHSLHNLSWFP